MDNYNDFAYLYDTFMDEVPYSEWCGNIIDILHEYGINDGLVLDLCCGTGVITRMLRDSGYDMIGVDGSEEMLEVARSHEGDNESPDILYINQDMRELELYGTVAAVVSTCDSINYLTQVSDLVKTFKLVNNYLDPGGLFIFDFNKIEKYESIGDATIAENREDCSFIWENYYDSDTHINEYELTVFTRVGELFERSEEIHIQRGYTLEEIRCAIEESGLMYVKHMELEDDRILMVAKEVTK